MADVGSDNGGVLFGGGVASRGVDTQGGVYGHGRQYQFAHGISVNGCIAFDSKGGAVGIFACACKGAMYAITVMEREDHLLFGCGVADSESRRLVSCYEKRICREVVVPVGNSKETGTETVQSDRTEVSDMTENSEKTGKEIGTTQTDQTDGVTETGEGAAAATEPDLKLVAEENTDTEQALSRNVTRYYEIEKGDTLYTISREIYGDLSKVQQICELNHIEDPDNISYGQKIILP